jgi:hypothetical protein
MAALLAGSVDLAREAEEAKFERGDPSKFGSLLRA